MEDSNGHENEHFALMMTWNEDEALAIPQTYRDRADAENKYDELKNQWRGS